MDETEKEVENKGSTAEEGIINDSNMRAESNEVSTIKPPEIKTLPKSLVDVTDMVKELPEPIKPIVVPTPAVSQDEPDRAALANVKLVQAKDEANVKASAEAVDANPESKLNLPYRDDQWSPFNRDGKKVYDRDFLLALRKDPKSNEKPENLPAGILANYEKRVGDISRYAVGGKSSSQRGAPPKHKSEKSKCNVPMEDTKLQETENAWGLVNIAKEEKVKATESVSIIPRRDVFEQVESLSKNILEEYLKGRCNLQECEQYIKASISLSALPQLVSDGYISVLEQSKTARLRTGFLFTQLIKSGTLSMQNYCAGLTNVLQEAEELIFDVPSVWDRVAELIFPVLCEVATTPIHSHMLFDLLITKSPAAKLLSFLFKMMIQEKNSNLQSTFASSTMLKRRNVNNDDGWSTATSRGSRTPFTVQSDKLKNKAPMMNEPLGSIQMFGNWGRGPNIKTTPQPPVMNTANMYAAIENIGTEKDKRSALGISQRLTLRTPVPKRQLPAGCLPVPAPADLTPDQLGRRLKNILEEYLNHCCSVQESNQDIKTSIPPSALPQLVSDGYISVLERSKTARLRTGYLFAQLIKLGTLSLQDYCAGLEAVLEEADELIIDIPKVWDYVAELISPVLYEGSATLQNLHKSFEPLVSKNSASKVLACLFKSIIQEKGPNFLQSSWNNSGLTFADYMVESQVVSFLKENNFEFLLEPGDSSPVSQSHSPALGQSQLSYEEIHDKLLAFFKSSTSLDDVINWIAANVGERVKEKQFIRTLATACFEDSIVNLKLKANILQGKYNLLHRFVDKKLTYELQCLYALQALINKLEHPQGLILAICDKLYEENVFSHDSFIAWEAIKDPAEQEGKSVALKQLASFFANLWEADEDSSSSQDF